ncbi:hypothetical protein V5O48_019643, partial [Marasmius crinis-equi]
MTSTEQPTQSTLKDTNDKPTLHTGSASPLDTAEVSQSVPDEIQKGVRMTKVTEKKVREATFRIDPDEGRIVYDSKKS